MKKRLRIYGLLGFLALFSLSLLSAGLPFLQAEEIPYLKEEISYEEPIRLGVLEPIDRDVIRNIVLIVIFFVLVVLGLAIPSYFLLRRPSLSKGVIMGIIMIPFVILIIYLAAAVVGIDRWRGMDIEVIFFLMSASIIVLITPIMLLIIHKKDSKRPEEQGMIFTNSALIGAKKGGIISLGLSFIIIGVILIGLLKGVMTSRELLFFALLLFSFIASLIILTIIPLRKILDIFIPLYFIPLLFVILSVLLSLWRMIEISYLFFAAEYLLPLVMILGLGYIGVLIGIFSGYINKKKRIGISTRIEMWITAFLTLLTPLTLVSLIFIIFVLAGIMHS